MIHLEPRKRSVGIRTDAVPYGWCTVDRFNERVDVVFVLWLRTPGREKERHVGERRCGSVMREESGEEHRYHVHVDENARVCDLAKAKFGSRSAAHLAESQPSALHLQASGILYPICKRRFEENQRAPRNGWWVVVRCQCRDFLSAMVAVFVYLVPNLCVLVSAMLTIRRRISYLLEARRSGCSGWPWR